MPATPLAPPAPLEQRVKLSRGRSLLNAIQERALNILPSKASLHIALGITVIILAVVLFPEVMLPALFWCMDAFMDVLFEWIPEAADVLLGGGELAELAVLIFFVFLVPPAVNTAYNIGWTVVSDLITGVVYVARALGSAIMYAFNCCCRPVDQTVESEVDPIVPTTVSPMAPMMKSTQPSQPLDAKKEVLTSVYALEFTPEDTSNTTPATWGDRAAASFRSLGTFFSSNASTISPVTPSSIASTTLPPATAVLTGATTRITASTATVITTSTATVSTTWASTFRLPTRGQGTGASEPTAPTRVYPSLTPGQATS